MQGAPLSNVGLMLPFLCLEKEARYKQKGNTRRKAEQLARCAVTRDQLPSKEDNPDPLTLICGDGGQPFAFLWRKKEVVPRTFSM